MLIRARSPLFIFHVLASVLAALCIGVWADILVGRESFLYRPEISVLTTWVSCGAALACLALAGLGAMEHAVNRGWNPPFLRVRIYGAELLSIDPPDLGQTLRRIHVRQPDGETLHFLACEDEAQGLRPGDFYRLDVFGQHVVEIRKVGEGARAPAAAPTRQMVFRTFHVGDSQTDGKGRQFMALLFPVGGGLIGLNLLPLVYQEDVILFQGRSHHLETFYGAAALTVNVPLVAAGAVLIFYGLYKWLKGWDPSELEALAEEASDGFILHKFFRSLEGQNPIEMATLTERKRNEDADGRSRH